MPKICMDLLRKRDREEWWMRSTRPETREPPRVPPMAADGSKAPEESVPSPGLGISPVRQRARARTFNTSTKAAKEGENVEVQEHSIN